ncbi:MAG: hypothetical protein Q7U04_13045, partial [Bacteriovorax sp.]|nr:hypothetical protein [Bacteriovorax sp.]
MKKWLQLLFVFTILMHTKFVMGDAFFKRDIFAVTSSLSGKKIDSVDCYSQKFFEQMDNKLDLFLESGGLVGSFASCVEVKKSSTERFSDTNCNLMTECSKLLTNREHPTFGNNLLITKSIALDYLAITLENELPLMNKMEALRKFAEKKYGKEFSAICKTPFDYAFKNNSNTNNCNPGYLDAGFNSSLKTSESQKEYKNFQSNYKSNTEGESLAQVYLQEKNELFVNEALANDSELLIYLSNIMSSKDKSNIKMKNIFSKLSEFKKQGKLDPILGYSKETQDFSNIDNQKNSHYKFFEKLLAAKNLNTASIKKAIEEYRMGVAKVLLGNSCKEAISFSVICENVSELSTNGRKIKIDRTQAGAFSLSSQIDEQFNILKDIYPEGVKTIDDSKIIIDARRCASFEFMDKNIPTRVESVMFDSRRSSFNGNRVSPFADLPLNIEKVDEKKLKNLID